MRIDVHSHLCPAELPDVAGELGDPRWPTIRVSPEGERSLVRNGSVYRRLDERYWGVARRIEYLDRYAIDVQAVSPLPVLLPDWAPPGAASAACAWLNEAVASFVAQCPDRLVGLGTVALHDPAGVEATLRHVRELGLVGVEIGTVYGGHELGSDDLRWFFTLAASLGIPVLVHPLDGAGGGFAGRMSDPAVRFSLGVTTDTAVAAASLVMHGVLEGDSPARVCLAHGGGTYYWARPRLRQVLTTTRGPESADALLGHDPFYVDTAMVAAANLRFLADEVDRSRVVLGSDYPATAAMDPLAALVEVGWDDDPRVAYQNAEVFLGLGAS